MNSKKTRRTCFSALPYLFSFLLISCGGAGGISPFGGGGGVNPVGAPTAPTLAASQENRDSSEETSEDAAVLRSGDGQVTTLASAPLPVGLPVTASTDLTGEGCLKNLQVKFPGETPTSDGEIPFTILLPVNPGVTDNFAPAVVEKVTVTPNTHGVNRAPCSECLDRQLRVVELDVVDEPSCDAGQGLIDCFRKAIETRSELIFPVGTKFRMQDFSYDSATQGYATGDWAPRDNGMYLFLLPPKNTPKVTGVVEITPEELKLMLTLLVLDERATQGVCRAYSRLREVRAIMGEGGTSRTFSTGGVFSTGTGGTFDIVDPDSAADPATARIAPLTNPILGTGTLSLTDCRVVYVRKCDANGVCRTVKQTVCD